MSKPTKIKEFKKYTVPQSNTSKNIMSSRKKIEKKKFLKKKNLVITSLI